MQYSASNTGSPCLIIAQGGRVTVHSLSGRSHWLMGRTAELAPDIPLSTPLASRNHGSFLLDGGKCYYLDNPQNTNGTYYNGRKIEKGSASRISLHSGDVLHIQSSRSAADRVAILFSNAPASGSWNRFELTRNRVTVGRNPGNDIVIALPFISGTHAQFDLSGGRCTVSDCGSKSGTQVNGRPLSGPQPLQTGDCISLCGKGLFFMGNYLLTEASSGSPQSNYQSVSSSGSVHSSSAASGKVILRADIQTKKVRNNSGSGLKELIRDIHLEIREGTLVALLGTAGAGKSTVMNCLNGMDLEGVQGRVLYRDVDLMRNFDQVKHLIGSVPQKKTFHPTFTPEQEFTYAAQKRLPPSVSSQEIQKRVNSTLAMLSMNGVRNVPNSKLSGGEQTRVNVGIELVADRDLLCLDEPDQGLSPNYKHELFQIMRDLAHKNGKSVLSIIHDVSEIEMFDQVIMLAKVDGVGRLAFSGSPEEAKRFFGVDIQYAYALLEQDPKKFVR